MDFEPGWAILAGLIGGAVMATILYMGIMTMPVGAAAFVMGAVVHAGMSVVFGLIHGTVFAADDGDGVPDAAPSLQRDSGGAVRRLGGLVLTTN
ncbi:MAG: hypothetical protein V3S20_08505 [Dehalococcoidia bacterium]